MRKIEAKQLGDIFYEMTYVRGSLRNVYNGGPCAGFRFNLDNPPLALGGTAVDFKLLVDGAVADAGAVWIRQRSSAVNAGSISEERPYTFHVGEPTEWTVDWPGGLSPGEHTIVIVTEQYAFGNIFSRFTIKDSVSGGLPEPSLLKTGEFHRPLALSNEASFAVLNWAGDLSADWNWWGLVTDNGGLYGPPARYIRSLRWSFAEAGGASRPLVRYTERAYHKPGRLEAVSRFGALTVTREVFMAPDESAVLTKFTVSNEGEEDAAVGLTGDLEAMLVPYGLLGVKAKGYRFKHDGRCLTMSNPQLPYVGVMASDAPFTTDFGGEYEGAGAALQIRVPLAVPGRSSVSATFVLAGDPADEAAAADIARRCLSAADALLQRSANEHLAYLAQTGEAQTGDFELDTAFTFAKLALKLLKFNHPEIGKGICAGFPRFPNYWSRDSAWTAFAYLAIGDLPLVKDVLLNFISLQLQEDRQGALAGDMPTVISGPGFMHQTSWGGSAEGVLLQVILYEQYVAASGDGEFAREHFASLRQSIGWAQRCDRDGDLFLEHGITGDVSTSQAFTIPDTQWMDHIDRRKSGNDVQGLYWHALRSAAAVADRIGEAGLAREWREMADRVERRYESVFWHAEGGYYYDRLLEDGTPDPTLRPNYAVNLMFSTMAGPERTASALERLESQEMTTPFGVRTRSATDEGAGYDPVSYQEGAVWNLTTGWTAMAELRAGRIRQGIAFLRMMAARITDEMGMGAELYRADRPEPLNGCFLQAWSIGMYVWCMMRYRNEIADGLRERR